MAEDKVLARCSCGRERKLARAKLSEGAKCEGCGEKLTLESLVESLVESRGESRGEGAAAKGSSAASDAGLPPPVDPFRLMSGMTGSGFAPTLLIAVGAHVVLLLISSIGFLKLCARHGTLDPGERIREIKDEEAAQAKKRKIDAAQEKIKVDKAKTAGAAKKAGGGAADAAAKSDGDAGAAKSPVEKRLEEKSKERPSEPTMNLDKALDLE